MAPTLLITRPNPAASKFAAQARRVLGRECEIVLSPLMRMEHVGGVPDLAGFHALIFTSRNGVEALAAATGDRSLPCYTVGDATCRAAQDAGFQAVSAQGDVLDLLNLIEANRAPGPFLYVRGEHATADVTGALRDKGKAAFDVVAYRQVAQPISDEAQALLGRARPVLLPLFSPRSARLFFDKGPFEAPVFAAAISPNVAEMIPPDAVRQVEIAGRPNAAGVLAGLQRLRDAAKRLEGGNRAQ